MTCPARRWERTSSGMKDYFAMLLSIRIVTFATKSEILKSGIGHLESVISENLMDCRLPGARCQMPDFKNSEMVPVVAARVVQALQNRPSRFSKPVGFPQVSPPRCS